MYAIEIENYRRDSKRSLSEYKLRKHMDSWKAAVIIFFGVGFFMLMNLSKGKQMTIVAAISMSMALLTPVHFV